MSKEYSHKCIKCKTDYTDFDEDDYYCASCNEERKRIAAEVDAKMSSRPRKETKSLLQIYDESPKVGGFAVFKDQF